MTSTLDSCVGGEGGAKTGALRGRTQAGGDDLHVDGGGRWLHPLPHPRLWDPCAAAWPPPAADRTHLQHLVHHRRRLLGGGRHLALHFVALRGAGAGSKGGGKGRVRSLRLALGQAAGCGAAAGGLPMPHASRRHQVATFTRAGPHPPTCSCPSFSMSRRKAASWLRTRRTLAASARATSSSCPSCASAAPSSASATNSGDCKGGGGAWSGAGRGVRAGRGAARCVQQRTGSSGPPPSARHAALRPARPPFGPAPAPRWPPSIGSPRA